MVVLHFFFELVYNYPFCESWYICRFWINIVSTIIEYLSFSWILHKKRRMYHLTQLRKATGILLVFVFGALVIQYSMTMNRKLLLLALKVPTQLQQTTFWNLFIPFSEKIWLDISCESSAWQMIHMKFQALFSLKTYILSSAKSFLGALEGYIFICINVTFFSTIW